MKILTLILLFSALSLVGQDENCTILDIPFTVVVSDDDPETPDTTPGPPSIKPSFRAEGDKIVHWVHGFGGKSTALAKARVISTNKQPDGNGGFINDAIGYPARKIISNSPSYDTGQDLNYYGNLIGDEINQFSYPLQDADEAQENFAVTASWGGNVVRYADFVLNQPGNDGLRLGGIVSMGGSHIGAELADNLLTTVNASDATTSNEFDNLIDFSAVGDVILTEKANNFLLEAKDCLSAGPELDAFDDIKFLSKLARSPVGEIIRGTFSDITDGIISSLPSVLGNGLFSRTGLNLQTDNEQQLQLAGFSGNTVNVAGFGEENQELGMWRLFYWGKNDPNNIPSSLPSYTESGQGFFEADSDQFALETFERNLAAYQMRQISSQEQADKFKEIHDDCQSPVYWIGNIGKCSQAKELYPANQETANAYAKGVLWFQNSSDFWEELTGALKFEPQEQDSGTCICRTGTHPWITETTTRCSLSNIEAFECNGNQAFVPDVFMVEVRRTSDMVVLSESASAFPGAVYKYPMIGSNHFNMRNDINTKTLLLRVFEGDPSLGLQFFETDEKN